MSLKKFFRPLTLLSYADMATLTSAFLGFLAITYIIDGSEAIFIVAMILLPICAIIDGMDGRADFIQMFLKEQAHLTESEL